MALGLSRRSSMILWQLAFVILSTSWLWAPQLNHLLSYKTSLISQYEVSGQAYSWLFRLGDIAGASLLIIMARSYLKNVTSKVPGYFLLVIGVGMLLDAALGTSCTITGNICVENTHSTFFLHATETIVTGLAIFCFSVYDTWLRQRLVSASFVIFQIGYFGLFLSQLADQNKFNTFSQFVYQTILVVWIAWFARDFLITGKQIIPSKREVRFVRYATATWAFINGILAILLSLSQLNLVGNLKGLYFAGDNAWLAQHGVVIGVVMLYLSRHLARGELRARQIFLLILGIESLKYSVLTPNPWLLMLYAVSFVVLFVLRDDFDRGIIPTTFKIRVRDALFMVGSVLFSGFLVLALLYKSNRLSDITVSSFDNFFDYVFRSKYIPHSHIPSALLAHTFSAFLLVSAGTILWILFKPSKKNERPGLDLHLQTVKELLGKYSSSSEDYFKLWPQDKQYFWSENKQGFIAYKVTGSIVFALADPVCEKIEQSKLLNDFVIWAKARRLRVCFLSIYQESLWMYKTANLNCLQTGASALINTDHFLNETIREKWWRWQKNRAEKNGFSYNLAQPPHSPEFISELKKISDNWLSSNNHQERGLTLGYFDEQYIADCQIHYLKNLDGQIIAFANQLPVFGNSRFATVDLLRYVDDVDGAMPYLLYKTIEQLKNEANYKFFDLGFVPFVDSKDPAIIITKLLSEGRFSARGLEQFKNKFDPDWQANYLAYDGDLADLALVALNLEKAMAIN